MTLEVATFGLGCFWEPEARFGALDGVWRTRVGYAGGVTLSPSYENLGDHIEVVQIDFDPERVSYEALLDLFWESHRPEFRAFSRQYMSAILPAGEAQLEAARASLRRQRRQRRWRLFARKIYTEIIPLDAFHLAEPYHQKYRLRQDPVLMREFARLCPEPKHFLDSTATARANAAVAGYLKSVEVISELGLSRAAASHLTRLVRGER